MCGIVGYIGNRDAVSVILDGLKRLEYRGYDSAGLAVLNGNGVELRRSVGKIEALEAHVQTEPLRGTVGLGHTRWATHGRPSAVNAHPHADCSGSLVVVHNGILENYLDLKEQLVREGHDFRSETDTEVIAHLIERSLAKGLTLLETIQTALGELRGAWAIGVLSEDAPDQLIAAKQGAGSIVIGLGEGEAFLASDIPAILPYTRSVVILEDGEIAVVSKQGVELRARDGQRVKRGASRISWDATMAQKNGYKHFMLKEIYEQPRAISDTMAGRLAEPSGDVLMPEARLDLETVKALRRVVFVACGTSYHAALVARSMVECLAGLPAEVDLASEFRYRDLILDPQNLVVAISQSGETADTLGAAKAARLRQAPVLAITNVVGSALAREAAGVIYTHAGPEIGVASTKTFTTTLTACYLLALHLGRGRGHLSAIDGTKRIEELRALPQTVETALSVDARVASLARHLAGYQNFLYLGRGVHCPIALEGALKLKELSYIHAEGYAAGEMKHGPIALIDERMPVVVLAPRNTSYDRMVANIEEVKARGGLIVAVAHEGDQEIARHADHVITVPPAPDLLAPIVSVIPLQLLAYHIAVLRGLDVDQPRNLAKSVTVE